MQKTILIVGLLAGLAGTALLAQTATAPEEAATAAPEAGTTNPDISATGGNSSSPGGHGGFDMAGHGSMGVPGLAPIESYDTNGDGTIRQDEIEARRAERFAQADANSDGALSAEELIAMEEAIREEVRQARAKAQATEIITRMDDNGDGLLQAEELEARTPLLAPMFDQFDLDNDGGISQVELEGDHSGRVGRNGDFGPGRHGQGSGPLGD